jgi:hypothetical protein
MKLQLVIFSLFICLQSFSSLQAQETIVDALKTSTGNEGAIDIESEPEITALLGKPSNKVNAGTEKYDIIKTSGFRVQVYMGNDQKRSRTEASDKQTLIKATFYDVNTYLTYDAPNWKLLAGDFVTREEAVLFKEVLQKEFPQLGKEMYIVTDRINVPVEKSN